jgi:hypothetical protein
MSDALLFTLIFAGLFVLRIIAATIFFALILPAGDRCLMCDSPTIRVTSSFDRWLPWFRRSWCLRCGWKGVLRRGAVSTESARSESLTRR